MGGLQLGAVLAMVGVVRELVLAFEFWLLVRQVRCVGKAGLGSSGAGVHSLWLDALGVMSDGRCMMLLSFAKLVCLWRLGW